MGVLLTFPQGRQPTTIRRGEGYMTKAQAAAFLGVSTRTVERYAVRDGLPFYTVRGRNLYRRTELDAWVESMSQQPT